VPITYRPCYSQLTIEVAIEDSTTKVFNPEPLDRAAGFMVSREFNSSASLS